MVKIPYIKIPGVRVGSIGPASNIGTGGATPAPPAPITYLTQWKIVGNSEVHTLPYPDGVVLPTGYKRCEYLKFDGNSYINTGVKTANDIGYDLRCKLNRTDLLIGGRYDAASNGFVIGFFQINSVAVAYGGGTITAIATTYSYLDSNVHRIILDSVKFQIDDEVIDITSKRNTAANFYDIYLGTWNNNGTADSRMWNSEIYDTVIYNTQGELWHGIPCLDANDVPCFYDIVSHTAFYNQGSGTFTYKLYPQPTEIWSCGEYNATDGKYHILVQPQGGSIADIALDEPLRKVNDVADSIEFPSDTEGKALVTRVCMNIDLGTCTYGSVGNGYYSDNISNVVKKPASGTSGIVLCAIYASNNRMWKAGCIGTTSTGSIWIGDTSYTSASAIKTALSGVEMIYELATPTTELVDAPQIEEADSYTCVISQGGKAVSWSSFETDRE